MTIIYFMARTHLIPWQTENWFLLHGFTYPLPRQCLYVYSFRPWVSIIIHGGANPLHLLNRLYIHQKDNNKKKICKPVCSQLFALKQQCMYSKAAFSDMVLLMILPWFWSKIVLFKYINSHVISTGTDISSVSCRVNVRNGDKKLIILTISVSVAQIECTVNTNSLISAHF